ncbi:DUF2514 family protein [Achromobacter sp. SIMBA_011]|uniref:DUF2514 family protein n=1 Tax=Achromobacter TaxID=222 RepID=UPI0011A61BC4|nr:DUF2514 family protein [Achromobacter dolens]
MSAVSGWLSMFSGRGILVPLLVASLAAGFAWNVRGWRAESQVAQLERRWADERAVASHVLATAQDEARMQTERRYEVVNEIRNEADENLARVLAAERAAADERLRQQAVLFARRQAGRCGHSHSAGVGASAADPIGLFAELFGELDRMAEVYASEADRRRVAGLACERTYSEIRGK